VTSVDPTSKYAPVFRAGRVCFVVDLRVYRLAAVQGAAYRLAARCTAVLGEVAGDSMCVELMFAEMTSEARALEVAREFFQELLDQELRQKIGAETAPLRNAILAHAYSRSGLPSDGRR
jgi:His-Xaa-Ser system protein HxsD